MTQRRKAKTFKPPKAAVGYDLDEMFTGCSQISGISFGSKKFAFELPKVPDLANMSKNAKNCLILSVSWSPKDLILNLVTLFAKV